ncbi:MAG: (d)CMP kinase [Spirochaetes bacterium]|nr:(d)CMP kinase [Spirochaetota bacterium]
MIIAIDGPAGSGKSTIAKIISEKMDLLYIDTGAMYRAITYAVLINNINGEDESAVNRMLKQIDLEFKQNDQNRIDIYLENKLINDQLRTHQVDKNVSLISSYAKVRQHCVKLQREIPENYDVILDGRDITTVVYPETPYKFYLDASVDERAKRRLLDAKNKEDLSLEEIKKDIIRRDKFDSGRELSPLKRAEDALYIDSSDMSIEEVADLIIEKCRK